MTNTFGCSGPMFTPAQTEYRKSLFNKEGGHYNIYKAIDERGGLEMLKNWFPNGDEMDEMKFVLFSTSGVHGSYLTIEEIEASLTKYPKGFDQDDDNVPDDYCGDELTFLLVQPRLVSMIYGNLKVTLDDIPYLKKLRAASWAAAQTVGAP